MSIFTRVSPSPWAIARHFSASDLEVIGRSLMKKWGQNASKVYGIRVVRMKLSGKEFDRIVDRAIQRLPGEIRRQMHNILISVQKRPSRQLLAEMGLPADEPLLGFFQGTPLHERSPAEPPLYPDTIVIFQDSLEAMCATVEELEREIEITVAHEVAHYLGFSEADLAELGYA